MIHLLTFPLVALLLCGGVAGVCRLLRVDPLVVADAVTFTKGCPR